MHLHQIRLCRICSHSAICTLIDQKNRLNLNHRDGQETCPLQCLKFCRGSVSVPNAGSFISQTDPHPAFLLYGYWLLCIKPVVNQLQTPQRSYPGKALGSLAMFIGRLLHSYFPEFQGDLRTEESASQSCKSRLETSDSAFSYHTG